MAFEKTKKILSFNCLSDDLINGIPPETISNTPIPEDSLCYVFNVVSNIIDRTFQYIDNEWKIKDIWGTNGGKIFDPFGNEIDMVNIVGTGLKVDPVSEYEINSGLQLVKNLGGPDGTTAQGIVTTTENILTPLSDVINLSTLYYPIIPQTFWVASTATTDDKDSTGARIILVGGLDLNYDPQQEFINLEGQTPVETSLEYIRITYANVITFGSATPIHGKQWPDGNIYVGGDSNFTLGIPDLPVIGINGNNADNFLKEVANRESIITVPNGFFLMVKDYEINTESGKEVRASINVRIYGETFFRMISPVTILGGNNKLSLVRKFPIPPRTDIQLRFKANVAGTAFTTLNFIGDLFSIF